MKINSKLSSYIRIPVGLPLYQCIKFNYVMLWSVWHHCLLASNIAISRCM